MGQVIERRLMGLGLGPVTLLDAVATDHEDGPRATLFLAAGSDPALLSHADGLEPLSVISGNAR